MTLRVLLQIVPFGNEEQVYNIGKIDISNVGYEQGSLDFYQYTAKQFDEKGSLIMESVDGHIRHKRSKGAWELVKKVLNLKGFLR